MDARVVAPQARVGLKEQPPTRRTYRPRSAAERARMRRVYRRRRIVAVAVLAGLLYGGWWVVSKARRAISNVDVEIVGLTDAGKLGAGAASSPRFRVPADANKVEVDGVDLRPRARKEGGSLIIEGDALTPGDHKLTVRRGRTVLPDGQRTINFEVDTTPPELHVPPPRPVNPRDGVVIEGTVDKSTESVRHGEQEVKVDKGKFRLEVPGPAPKIVAVTALDDAGNEAKVDVPVATIQPRTRAVHMTAQAWSVESLREPVLRLLEEKKIDTIELDVKDESGVVGYRTEVSVADDVGAVKEYLDLEDTVEDIHRRGGRVIGRIVAYRDPLYADHAWGNGARDRLVRTPDGARYGAYGGGFLNPINPDVQAYTTDLAVEAARAGMDEVLLDYIRRPDGPLEGMRFPGLEEHSDAEATLEGAIADHVADMHTKVRAHGARLGASVFGIAATRPHEIAQDIPRLARHLDYVAPMLYPSHWAKGEFGIADPNRSPGEVITASLPAFGYAVDGTGAALVPWLQDFSLGYTYGEKEVRAQIDASRDLGVDSFILWDPACTYTEAALDAA